MIIDVLAGYWRAGLGYKVFGYIQLFVFLGKFSRKNCFLAISRIFWGKSKNVTDSYSTYKERSFDISLSSVVSESEKTIF